MSHVDVNTVYPASEGFSKHLLVKYDSMQVICQLQEWREPAKSSSVQSRQVLKLFLQYEKIIRSIVSKEELYLILEQAFIAACDCHRLHVAFRLLTELKETFPDSHRVDRLLTLMFEAQENDKGALEGYTALTEEDALDTMSRKRQIVIALSQKGPNARQQAITMLIEYIGQFQSDQEAWMMLANLYTLEWKLAYAAYCLEEVILHMPDNRHVICRYAETKASICPHSDGQQLLVARKYFLYANKLCPKWTRPLFGIVYCCVRLKRSDVASEEMLDWARKQIRELVTDTKFGKVVNDVFLKNYTSAS